MRSAGDVPAALSPDRRVMIECSRLRQLDAGLPDHLLLDLGIASEHLRELYAVAIDRLLACLANRFHEATIARDRFAPALDLLHRLGGQPLGADQAAIRGADDGITHFLHR